MNLHLPRILLLSALFTPLTVALTAQNSAKAPATPGQTAPSPATPVTAPPSSSAAATGAALPSALLKPSLDSIPQTLTLLHPDRWKLSGAMKQETQANLTSIQADVKTTLPPLLATADQHPDSVVQVLPVVRNASALYDVLLRVAQVATISAPSMQASALQQTIALFEKNRRELEDVLQASAQAGEQQAIAVQAQLHTLQSTPPPPPVVCPTAPAPAPAKKRKPHPKAAAATP